MSYCLRLPKFAQVEVSFFFFFNDTATTEIYTFPYTTLFRSSEGHLLAMRRVSHLLECLSPDEIVVKLDQRDRKSTRLNSSHLVISYAVFCLKKKKIVLGL